MLKTRPSASKTSVQMSDGPRMTSLVDFGRSRRSSDPERIALRSSLKLIETSYTWLYSTSETLLDRYTELLYYRYRTALFGTQLPTDDEGWSSPLFIQEWPPGGGPRPRGVLVYKSPWNKHSVSFSLSGALQWTSHHWKSLSTISHAKV